MASSTNAVNEGGLVIPLIDFSKFTFGDPTARKQCATAILHGFQTAGFIYLYNIPITPASRAATFDFSSRFFAQPLSAKQALAWTTPEANRGYSAFGREKVSMLKSKEEVDRVRNATPDVKESYEIAREDDGLPNQWPGDEEGAGIVGFREKMVEFFDECKKLYVEIMQAIAVGIGIEEGYFDRFTDDGDNTLRLLHYPPVKAEAFETAVRAGQHTDYGTITILFQDDRGGLQVQSPNGKFIDADPIKDAVVINAGDLLTRWSNDTIKSTIHRVVEPPSKLPEYPARYSVAYFCNPNYKDIIEAIPETYKTESDKKYEAINSGEYLKQRLAATYEKK